MKAMILAAGRGERLKPLTDRTPKPMLPLGGKPLIAHQLSWLRAAGVTEVVINLHHLGDQIEAFCGTGQGSDLTIAYSREKVLLETAGGLIKALPLLGDDPFMLLNGDIYTDFDFTQLPSAPPSWADLHVVLIPTPTFRAQGDFEYANGRVVRRGNTFVYACIAVVRPAWLRTLAPTGTPLSLQQPLFDAVAQGRVSAQVWPGRWTDIGSPEQLQAIQQELESS